MIILHVNGVGHIPSKKNNKFLTRGRLITKPEYQKVIKKIIDGFVSELLSGSAIIGAGMPMDASRRFWIASQLPEDDCWTWIPEITVKGLPCPKGMEGATIEIEEI